MGFNNTLNSMMDHVWDGFYTGQLRLSRFPGQLETNQDYTIEMAGTPPKKMRYELDADVGGVKLKIPYPVAGAYVVSVDGKQIDYTEWDAALGRAKPLTKAKGCGENRYVGVENFLEFYLTPGCIITVEPKDSIMTKVRLDWTLAAFYADGGVTRFVDRMAASLGIAAHRIKTVAVYEGSVIVDFYVEALVTEDDDEESTASQLDSLQKLIVDNISTGSLDLGASVMGLQSEEGELLFGDPIPTAPNANDITDFESSAIVGDTNLWDDLIIERPEETDSSESTTQTEETTPTSQTGETSTSPSSSTIETTTTTPTTSTTTTSQTETESITGSSGGSKSDQ